MNTLLAAMIILISGLLGMLADSTGLLTHHADFWLVGIVSGGLAGALGVYFHTKGVIE